MSTFHLLPPKKPGSRLRFFSHHKNQDNNSDTTSVQGQAAPVDEEEFIDPKEEQAAFDENKASSANPDTSSKDMREHRFINQEGAHSQASTQTTPEPSWAPPELLAEDDKAQQLSDQMPEYSPQTTPSAEPSEEQQPLHPPTQGIRIVGDDEHQELSDEPIEKFTEESSHSKKQTSSEWTVDDNPVAELGPEESEFVQEEQS